MNTKNLTFLAAASFAALLLGVVFNALVLALFGIAVSALLVLIAATDYAPRRSYWVSAESDAQRCRAGTPTHCEILPFAA